MTEEVVKLTIGRVADTNAKLYRFSFRQRYAGICASLLGSADLSQNTVGRPIEILLVEDSLTSARLTIGALKKGEFEHRLTWISDGNEAVEFLFRRGKYGQAPRPDMILLDLGLPGKDGREVLTEIKACDDLSGIPVVVMTASTDQEDIVRTQQLQVESYLVKPVDLEKFLRLVKELKRFWLHEEVILPTVD